MSYPSFLLDLTKARHFAMPFWRIFCAIFPSERSSIAPYGHKRMHSVTFLSEAPAARFSRSGSHRSHFLKVPKVPFAVMNDIVPNGQEVTHTLQPVHFVSSIDITPVFSLRFMAPLMHALMQTGLAHCWQTTGRLMLLPSIFFTVMAESLGLK
jgi:hypothetical protein